MKALGQDMERFSQCFLFEFSGCLTVRGGLPWDYFQKRPLPSELIFEKSKLILILAFKEYYFVSTLR